MAFEVTDQLKWGLELLHEAKERGVEPIEAANFFIDLAARLAIDCSSAERKDFLAMASDSFTHAAEVKDDLRARR